MAAITEAEYDRWLEPRDAADQIVRAGLDRAAAQKAILNEFAKDGILAAARLVIRTAGSQAFSPLKNEVLNPGKWADGPRSDDRLWEHGEISFPRQWTKAGYLIFACSGVRFEPAGIEAIAARLAKPSPDPLSAASRTPPPPSWTARGVGGRDYQPEWEAEDRTLTEAEYERWLRPLEALARLPGHLSFDGKRSAIAERMQLGRLRAVAEVLEDRRGKQHDRIVIGRKTWEHWSYLGTDAASLAFWDRGSFDKYGATSGGYGGGPLEAKLVGVRLNPEDIGKLVESVTPRPPPGSREAENLPGWSTAGRAELLRGHDDQHEAEGAGKVAEESALAEPIVAPVMREPKPPKVAPKEVREWYRSQFAENPGLAFHEVEALASAHFRPRRVTRQPLRDAISELGHTQGPGNPAIRRK